MWLHWLDGLHGNRHEVAVPGARMASKSRGRHTGFSLDSLSDKAWYLQTPLRLPLSIADTCKRFQFLAKIRAYINPRHMVTATQDVSRLRTYVRDYYPCELALTVTPPTTKSTMNITSLYIIFYANSLGCQFQKCLSASHSASSSWSYSWSFEKWVKLSMMPSGEGSNFTRNTFPSTSQEIYDWILLKRG